MTNLRLHSLALRRKQRTDAQAHQLENTWEAIDHALDDQDWQKALGVLANLPKETETYSVKCSKLTNRLSQEFVRLIDARDASSAAWVDYLISYLDNNLSGERKASIQTLMDTIEEIEATYGDCDRFPPTERRTDRQHCRANWRSATEERLGKNEKLSEQEKSNQELTGSLIKSEEQSQKWQALNQALEQQITDLTEKYRAAETQLDNKAGNSTVPVSPVELSYAYVPEVLGLPLYENGYCTIPPILIEIKTDQAIDPLEIKLNMCDPASRKVWKGSIINRSDILTIQDSGVEYILIKDILWNMPDLGMHEQKFPSGFNDIQFTVKNTIFRLDPISLIKGGSFVAQYRNNSKGLYYLDGFEGEDLGRENNCRVIGYCQYQKAQKIKLFLRILQLSSGSEVKAGKFYWLQEDDVIGFYGQLLNDYNIPAVNPLFTIKPLTPREIIQKLKNKLKPAEPIKTGE